jgi:hypothetical protein
MSTSFLDHYAPPWVPVSKKLHKRNGSHISRVVIHTFTSNPSISKALRRSLDTRIRLLGGTRYFSSPVCRSYSKKFPASPLSTAVASTKVSGSRSTRSCGSKETKSSNAQWIVRPHLAPRYEGVGSRSKRLNLGVGIKGDVEWRLRRDCARRRPVIPAQIMRM